ncbi:MAG: hypothetical protein LBM70_03245 [Victivallales bacterium]|jgi:V/A-type H+-transporting ATPase subunit K|nr:hypothetical protein [Victivallales bacterium]
MEQEMMLALSKVGGYAAVGLAAIGSSLGTGVAGAAAIGAWKKCYLQDKPAPFLLLAMAGAPLSQTIYGMIMMILIGGAAAKNPQNWPLYLAIGIFGGFAEMISAAFQGRAAAGGCNAYAETNQGFANDLMILGVIETCSIFALVFSIMVM